LWHIALDWLMLGWVEYLIWTGLYQV